MGLSQTLCETNFNRLRKRCFRSWPPKELSYSTVFESYLHNMRDIERLVHHENKKKT